MKTISAPKAMALSPEQRKQVAIREKLHGMAQTDIVRRWYESEEPFDLTPTEEEIRKRWDFAKAQFLDRRTYTQTMEALMDEFSISIAQARNDIRNMRATFGPIDDVPKIAKRQLAMKMALEAFDVAKEGKDPDGMSKATQAYIKAAGLDREDQEPFDLDKLMKERTYVEIIDPQIRTLLLNVLAGGGSLDTTMLFQNLQATKDKADYTDFETVSDNDNP